MENQRQLVGQTDSLANVSPAHQVVSDGFIFPLGYIPGHNFAAPNVDHQIKVDPLTSQGGGQVSDLPAQHLILAIGPGNVALAWVLAVSAVGHANGLGRGCGAHGPS